MARRLVTILLCLLLLPVLSPQTGGRPAPNAATCISPLGRDVVLVFDRSASMLDQGKLAAGKSAADALLGTLSPTQDQSALVSFATDFRLDKGLDHNHTTAQNATASTQTKVDALAADGATSLGGAVRMARYELDNGGPHEVPPYYSHNASPTSRHVMVVLTDGDQTINAAEPVTEATIAKNDVPPVRVVTVALGTSFSSTGLSVLQQMASSPADAFVAPDPATLAAVFRQISYQLNDTQVPVVSFASPTTARYLRNGVDSGPSPLGIPIISGSVTVSANPSDDCVVDRVVFSVDGADFATVTDAPYAASLDCESLSAGYHTLRLTVWDWLNKTSYAEEQIACVRAYADAQAKAFHLQAVDPLAPQLDAPGATLPPWLPHPGTAGAQSALAQASGTSPDAYAAALLWDIANGTAPNVTGNPDRAAVASLSRQANVSLDALRVDALQTNASARVDLANLTLKTYSGSNHGQVSGIDSQFAAALNTAALCTADVGPVLGTSVQTCFVNVTLGPGVSLRLDEVITVTGVASKEVTVNGLHLIVERPEGRAEVILSQSYAGVSWLGPSVLRGPVRSLDAANDAGSGADAPGAPATALHVGPGVYGGRLDSAQDADAYNVTVGMGQKVHALITPASGAAARFQTLPLLPVTAPTTPFLAARLLAPDGTTRDLKASLAPGAPVSVELNADLAGGWVIVITGTGPAGYSMVLGVEDAPMTHANDALLGQDAGDACADPMLVGPGVHVGTLEAGDAADWYALPATEGQTLALALRPGDTPDAAAMDLQLAGPGCNLLANGAVVGAGIVKGAPQEILYTVPTGGSGLYHVGVLHRNGLGTYEVTTATSVAAP